MHYNRTLKNGIFFLFTGFISIMGFLLYISLDKPITRDLSFRSTLISYAEGEIYIANQNLLHKFAVNKGFDEMIAYNKRDIDSAFYEKNNKILSYQRGAGYWLWKPYIILKTLEKMKEGEYLFYIDSGVLFVGRAEGFIQKMRNHDKDILAFNNSHSNRQYIKKDVFDILEIDLKYREAKQIDAGLCLVFKNTKSTREIVKKWLELCTSERLLTDSPSQNGEFEDFIEHRHDQSLLTLVYYQTPENFILVDRKDKLLNNLYHHRRRNYLELIVPGAIKHICKRWIYGS